MLLLYYALYALDGLNLVGCWWVANPQNGCLCFFYGLDLNLNFSYTI